jgi:iron-only hydrogenase group A
VCERNGNCELQDLAQELNIREDRFAGKIPDHPVDTSSQSLIRDPQKCVMCRRCETMCNEVQTVGVYSAVSRSIEAVVSTAFDAPMMDTSCTFCGQCVSVCPTGALTQKVDIGGVWDALNDPEKFVVVQAAPAIRVALGEEFNLPAGEIVTGKMVAALRRLGFDKIYDTNFGADLTVMEEATELVGRIQNGGTLPMLTSCCPAWVKFIEHHFPTLLNVPSTCKSPHQMLGILAKTYVAPKLNVKPENMVVVSIMPCLAKKYEAAREEMANDGLVDVDYVLTTRELAAMLREAGVNFASLPDEKFDPVMGESTGAGTIFGVAGGVSEATARTAATLLPGTDFKIGTASGLGNARKLLEDVRDGKADYHIIEIMACPGGCVAGGGQPYCGGSREVVAKRTAALRAEGEGKTTCAHDNAEIKALYAEFLEKPGSHKAHDLLHTTFTERTRL